MQQREGVFPKESQVVSRLSFVVMRMNIEATAVGYEVNTQHFWPIEDRSEKCISK